MSEARTKIKRESLALCAIVLLLSTLYSYLGYDVMIPVGGFDVYSYFFIAVASIFLAVLVFIVAPKLDRMSVLLSQTAIQMTPLAFPFIWSILVWIAGQANLLELRKGLVTAAYMLSGIGMVCAFTYLTGEKAAYLDLLGLLLANLFKATQVALEGGVEEFFRQFQRLIVTFAGETGELMQKVELQGVTYALGCYLIFFLLSKKGKYRNWPLLLVTLFFFMMGLKRIAAFGVVLALILAFFLEKVSKSEEVRNLILKIAGVVLIVAVLAYIGGVYYGLYDYLESIGIDTNLRDQIYQNYWPYYTFSPAFLGNGLGWVESQMAIWAEMGEDYYNTHNEFLKQFIELGMIGSMIWLWLRCNLQVKDAFKRLGVENGILAVALVVYILCTYTTDTTGTQVHLCNSFAVILFSANLYNREDKKYIEMELANHRFSERQEERI